MAVLHNIYPPTLPTYGETFIIGQTYKLFFSISKFNRIEGENADISNVAQLVIYKQNTNISVANKTLAPCDILRKEISNASEEDIKKYNLGDRKYYIEIQPSDLETGNFEINTYYRVQIRFISNMINQNDIPSKFDSAWLANKIDYFSEWSTVSLIREISSINIELQNFDSGNNLNGPIRWTSGEVDVVGKISFSDPEEKDSLKSYQIQFIDEDNEVIWDSGEIYNQAYTGVGENEINYTINRIFKDGEQYTLKIGYTTKTLYSDEKSYEIIMLDEGLEKLDVSFSPFEDVENGRIILNIRNNASDVFNGNLIIRRTSGDSDFTIWEDVVVASVENTVLNYTFYDYTIESGKWYRYGVQTRNNQGQRGLLTLCDQSLMVEFEDIFINADGKQLGLKFNPQVSSFQRTISENKVDTIGGKYPYIKRNGNMEYKQFPISGLITQFIDRHDYEPILNDSINGAFSFKEEGNNNPNFNNALFTSKEELYGEEVLSLYDERNEKNNITPIDDITYEKDFREAVMDFLYKNNVKLYRSATEGNILIKLMNITFTPNQSLGRKIWSFSATAYEIDECSIKNYDKYGIQTIGTAIAHFEYINNYLGQLRIEATANSNIITNYLQKVYDADVYHKEKYITRINYLNHARIEFLSKPYLIDISNGTPTIWAYQEGLPDTSMELAEKAILGYLVYINGKPIVVRNSNVYELKNEGVKITDISFPVETEIFLDYKLSLSQEPEEQKIITAMFYLNRIGQVKYVFEPRSNLINYIRSHFNVKATDVGGPFYQELSSINGIRLEADEGAIVYVKENREETAQRHIIGPTNSLDFWDPDSSITEVYFYGMRLTEALDYDLNRNFLMNNKFIDTQIMALHLEDVENPIKNGLYWIGENVEPWIWYQGFWYKCQSTEFTSVYEIRCPVSAMMDYHCEIAKGYYAA